MEYRKGKWHGLGALSEGPLLVQRIYPDRVEGLNYPEYPIAMDEGLPITLRVGEKASNGCTVFLTLAKIDDGRATLKQVDALQA